MENYERIELLLEAKDKLNQSIDLIEEALRGTVHESHADAYILGHLRTWVDSGMYSRDTGIEQYIEHIENPETEEEF